MLAVSCGSPREGEPPGPSEPGVDGASATLVPWPVTEFPATKEPDDNPGTPEKVALGRALFYDPVVSSDREVACATCHSEVWGMSDGLPRAVGVGGGLLAGPGREGPSVMRRNAPTLWNVAFRTSTFWDGRGTTLEDQVQFPFQAKDEFNRPFDDVLGDLRANATYRDLFAKAFPGDAEPITAPAFSKAIAAFERTLISNRGLYDAYVDGDLLAMNDEMIRGMKLFDEVGCASCHAPPLFSSETFADRGVKSATPDLGRYEISGSDADRNHFKVPTLRNVHESAPYFHDGSAETLEDAVRHEALVSAERDGARSLDDDEIGAVSAFLYKGLFDTRQSPTRPYEVPSGFPVPIDSFRTRR